MTTGLEGLPIAKPPYGVLTAIDLNTGDLKFQVPHGDTPDTVRAALQRLGINYPEKTGQAGSVGLMVTKTLVVVGDPLVTCDRPNDRIQVLTPEGEFVKEVFIAKRTLGDGSVWDITFSKDPEQKYLFLADGKNEKIYVILRETLEILTSFGDGGRQPGQFFAAHSIASDSRGNLYTTEAYEGKRIQKFVYTGLAPVTKMDQGAPWPASK